MKCGRIFGLVPLLLGMASAAWAAEVHLSEQTLAGGVTTLITDQKIVSTGEVTSSVAPEIAGYFFTHWSINTVQEFNPVDADGRAYDAVPFKIYEDTLLTANYLPASQDEDEDGVADGWELYWYGNLDQDAQADTDGDGYTFEKELAAGLNPHLPDSHFSGVVWDQSEALLYNPENYQPYTLRSEPEGKLFATIVDWVKPGTRVTTPSMADEATFAYWTMDGVDQRDGDGRAEDAVTFTMPARATELVAHSIDDPLLRAQCYWYGSDQYGLASDTDGDGYTFEAELAAGLNPLFPDGHTAFGVVWADSTLTQYALTDYYRYTIRSNPEGGLCETVSELAKAGTLITTPVLSPEDSTFAYWTQDGVPVRDAEGRALDCVTFTLTKDTELVAVSEPDKAKRMALYWYGQDVETELDSDGDGYTFAEELAAGLNPHFPDSHTNHGVVWADTARTEVNLQVYDQGRGVLMKGNYTDFFTSPIAGTQGVDFGDYAAPAVLDWDADGKPDLVVAFSGGIRLFLNRGTRATPDLEEQVVPEALATAIAAVREPVLAGLGSQGLYFADRADAAAGLAFYDVATQQVTQVGEATHFGVRQAALVTLEELNLDTPLVNGEALTFGDVDADGAVDLLASDAEGRIWCYTADAEGALTLQHKVWGGSYPGFANALTLAAIDWDDDGDADCVAGTAEGTLLLLTDPRGGRPSNVALAAGADSVSLKWDPLAQSRIRGYSVYRTPADMVAWARVEQTTLPRYLDTPPEGAEAYAYRVTSVSRFYKAGYSKPITVESVPTEPVTAELAKVRFTWRPTAGFTGEDVTVDFSVENAWHLAANHLQLRVSYNPDILVPVEVKRSGLTELMTFAETRAAGSWLVSGTGGTIEAGTGTFLSFVFAVADGAALADAAVKVEEFTLRSIAERNVLPDLEEATGGILLEDVDPDDAAQVPAGSRGDLDGDGRLGWADIELFLQWKDAAPEQIPEAIRQASDYNGDGKMDNRDYLLMRRHYRDREKRGGRMTGWDKNHGYRGTKE